MKNLKNIFVGLFAAVGFFAIAQDDAMTNISPIAERAMANCDGPVWGATDADSIKGITNYSLYREDFKMAEKSQSAESKAKGHESALIGWKYVFFNHPAAKVTTHIDGVKMYKAKYKAAAEGPAKEGYLDTLLAIYEVREHCFGSNADLSMRKAFEWYNYRKKDNEVFLFEMFNATIDQFDKDEETSVYDISPAFLYPWIGITVTGEKKNLISEDDVFDVYERITDIVEHNVEVGKDAGKFVGAGDKVTQFMDKYGYLTCDNLIGSAQKKWDADKSGESAVKVYKMLKAGKCYDAPFFLEVVEKVAQENPTPGLYKFLASKARKDGNQTKAIEYTTKALEMTTGSEEQAAFYLRIAMDYQSKGDYPSARTNAMKAAELKPNWGAPYLLVGRLYASSGSRCGSGTGWDSQVVTWVAIDQFQKAKSVDPSSAEEAQKLINQYSKYMPTKQDCFLRNESDGGSYTVGCWINRTTTIRCANN